MSYPFLGDEAQVASLVGATVSEVYDIVEASDTIIRARLGNAGLSAETMGLINEFHAAHLFSIAATSGGGILQSERLGDWSATYAASADLSDLRSTRFGRIAVELDTSGILSEASKPKAAFAVL
jgi:hypothetical protein